MGGAWEKKKCKVNINRVNPTRGEGEPVGWTKMGWREPSPKKQNPPNTNGGGGEQEGEKNVLWLMTDGEGDRGGGN